MSKTVQQNIVNLEDYGQLRRSLGNGAGTKALRSTRDLATAKLKHHIDRMMEKVDDALFARAEKAENNMNQTQYFDAMRELRIIRKDIEEDFLSGFESRFNQGVPRQTSSSDSFNLSLDDNDGGLGLVDKKDLEEELAISNMVNKVRNASKQALYALDKRIGLLINDPDLDHWQNPLGPESICDAFHEAARRIETGLEIRLVIFKLFDQHVINHLGELYKEVNSNLVSMGVLPEIKTTIRRNPNPAGGAYAPAPGTAAPGGEPPQGGQQGGYPPAAPPANGGLAGAAYGTGVYSNGGYQGAAAGSPISALTLLQHGSVPAPGNEAGGEGFAVNPTDLASGQVNILHSLRNSSLAEGLGKGGDMTIDIVAMLFDYILDDKNIQDAMRALIGRLQIPLLKVALLDNAFFTRKSHPARRLLNRLASTAVDWEEEDGNQDPLYLKIQSIVQTILDEFDDDIGLFETLLADLEDFLSQEEKQAEIRAERSARIMEGKERLDEAKSTTLEEIEPRISDEQNLDFIRDFVTTHWKNLLFITCARQGKDSTAWKNAVATMDDLIWSVKPKHTREDRQKLVSMQPGLLTRLREGMERLSIPATERDDFIAMLIRAHGRTAINTPDADVAATPPTQDDHTDSTVNEAGDAGAPHSEDDTADEQKAKPPAKKIVAQPAPEINDDFTARARQLTTGTWVEFSGSDGQRQRAKLSWISPITNTYLFTDRKGLKAGNYSLEEFALLLRCARARILDSAPLMDRAVSTVFEEYQKH
ncbi:MAG TPA: DUF1631 domain-containing protein [Gammaproteobacteria bacterium]|nr:DUF1631 domain-containing protein [Gammaproteobacteria bacterium]